MNSNSAFFSLLQLWAEQVTKKANKFFSDNINLYSPNKKKAIYLFIKKSILSIKLSTRAFRFWNEISIAAVNGLPVWLSFRPEHISIPFSLESYAQFTHERKMKRKTRIENVLNHKWGIQSSLFNLLARCVCTCDMHNNVDKILKLCFRALRHKKWFRAMKL